MNTQLSTAHKKRIMDLLSKEYETLILNEILDINGLVLYYLSKAQKSDNKEKKEKFLKYVAFLESKLEEKVGEGEQIYESTIIRDEIEKPQSFYRNAYN